MVPAIASGDGSGGDVSSIVVYGFMDEKYNHAEIYSNGCVNINGMLLSLLRYKLCLRNE